MASPKSWLKAARLRTLPLALSGIIMGSALAAFYGSFKLSVFVLAVLTATFIQIFSNFANDYGDFQKGTDNQQRLGPTRTMQGGEISVKEMKQGMFLIGGLSFILGILLVYFGTWQQSPTAFFVFIGLGILALLAAYFYTAGKRSYGYVGLGDLAVFLFFGLLPVIGVFFLHSAMFKPTIILPATCMGLFSTGVLNLNNMRDIENDRNSGKITLAVKLGKDKSRLYHNFLISGAWLTILLYTMLNKQSYWQWIFLLIAPVFLSDLLKIAQISDNQNLDPFLKRLALQTLGITLLFSLGLILAS